jgi:hypothetical protein
MMQARRTLTAAAVLCIAAGPIAALQIDDDAGGTTIRTAHYEAYWDKSDPMGFSSVKVPGLKKPLVAGGRLYQDLDYRGGRRTWGPAKKAVVEKAGKGAVITYTAHDNAVIEYTVVLTCWDDQPFLRVDVTATVDKGAEPATWPATGYDPILEPSRPVDQIDLVKWDHVQKKGDMMLWKEPIPHIAYWTEDGFAALYADSPDAKPRFGEWHGWYALIRLDHALLGVNIKPQQSNKIAYYVGFGPGGSDAAHALAEKIGAGAPVDPRPVEPTGALPALWARIKASH